MYVICFDFSFKRSCFFQTTVYSRLLFGIKKYGTMKSKLATYFAVYKVDFGYHTIIINHNNKHYNIKGKTCFMDN